ncbi:MAG: hypothetical protein EBU90_28300 [Proteobacteria bacterium]|nr:hypothetical protein [Pseudomonadota bacterium]
MIQYKLREIDGDVFVIREETSQYIVEGLPPTTSHFLILKKNEVPDLINFLSEYANKNRDN